MLKKLLLITGLLLTTNAWAGLCDGPIANNPEFQAYCLKQKTKTLSADAISLTVIPESCKNNNVKSKSCREDLEAVYPSCDSQFTRVSCFEEYETATYYGDWYKDNLHGVGFMFYKTGAIFFGDFQEGSINGKGTYYFEDGGLYVGDYKDGYMNGYGTHYHENGDIYQGQFKDNKYHGKGICKLSKKTSQDLERVGWKRPSNLKEGQDIFECRWKEDKLVRSKSPGRWFAEFTKGFLQGAIEGAIEGAITGAILGSVMEPCVPEVKVKTSQKIPGAPQYGTKTRTTIKPCASAYQFK